MSPNRQNSPYRHVDHKPNAKYSRDDLCLIWKESVKTVCCERIWRKSLQNKQINQSINKWTRLSKNNDSADKRKKLVYLGTGTIHCYGVEMGDWRLRVKWVNALLQKNIHKSHPQWHPKWHHEWLPKSYLEWHPEYSPEWCPIWHPELCSH